MSAAIVAAAVRESLSSKPSSVHEPPPRQSRPSGTQASTTLPSTVVTGRHEAPAGQEPQSPAQKRAVADAQTREEHWLLALHASQ